MEGWKENKKMCLIRQLTMLYSGLHLYFRICLTQTQRAEVVKSAMLLLCAWLLVNRGLELGVCSSCLTSPVDQYQLLELEACSYFDRAVGVT